jgi:hypothetical protein
MKSSFIITPYMFDKPTHLMSGTQGKIYMTKLKNASTEVRPTNPITTLFPSHQCHDTWVRHLSQANRGTTSPGTMESKSQHWRLWHSGMRDRKIQEKEVIDSRRGGKS